MKAKVKGFWESNIIELGNKISNFLNEKNINSENLVDIKYNVEIYEYTTTNFKGRTDSKFIHSALVIYKEG